LAKKWRWILPLLIFIFAAIAISSWKIASAPEPPREAPETAKILEVQEGLHFGVLIPAYLPRGFDREHMEIKVSQTGTGGEPMVDMIYWNSKGRPLFIRQWVPVNPELETLVGSRPVETKWGKGWLLTQAKGGLICLWVDVGPLRVSLITQDLEAISREEMILAANTLGLASNLQVYTFYTELPSVKGVAPPPPFEVPVNSEGIQEFNLTITPGGYSPMRFAVQKGVPVKMHFRALGEVGCGNTLIFPADLKNPTALLLESEQDVKTLEFTPGQAGNFAFQCTNNCFRGIMTVKEPAP
jgi:hypothetical protein